MAVRNPATPIRGVDSYELIDVFGSFRVKESISLRAGIDNLLDPEPEIVGELPGVNNEGATRCRVFTTFWEAFLGRCEL